MSYNQLVGINQAKDKKEVVAVFGEQITENTAYHIIYDLSESKFKNESGELEDFIQTLINKANFAKMQEVTAIKEAYKHYEANEAVCNACF